MKDLSKRTDDLRSRLEGTWYGHQKTEDGGSYEFVTHLMASGIYAVSFRVIEADGEILEQTECGHWGASAGFYFTLHRITIDNLGTYFPAASDDVYEVLKADSEQRITYHLTSRTKFVAKRVDSDFWFDKVEGAKFNQRPNFTTLCTILLEPKTSPESSA